jgi:hypothetical protein
VINGPSGSAPASVSAVLAERLQGRADPEANYLRAIYYLAGALWFVDAGDQALNVLSGLFADTMATIQAGHGESHPC